MERPNRRNKTRPGRAGKPVGFLMSFVIALIGGILLAGAPLLANTPLNALPPVSSPKPVDLRVEYLIDSTDQLTVQQLTSPQVRWQTASQPTIVLGFLNHPVWYRFTLQPTTPDTRPLALELTNFYVDSLTLYQPDGAGHWQVQHTGDLIPFARRNPATRYPALYLSLTGPAPQTIYARVLFSQHHDYRWQLWNRPAFDAVRLPDFDRYIALTVTVVMLLFSLALLAFMYRFAVLRSYALWGLAFNVTNLFNSGYSNLYFPHSPYWAHITYYVSMGLLLPALAYFVVQACRLSQVWPRLVGVYIGFGCIGIAYAALSVVYRHPYVTWAFIAALALLLILTSVLIVALYLSGNRPALGNVLLLVALAPIHAYYYGRNAGFFSGSLSVQTLNSLMFITTIAEPFFFVMLLWQATRERIQTAEQLQLEAARRTDLQLLDQLKTNFFANVAHELRTPLTLLLGPVKTLLQEHQLTTRQHALLQVAQRSGQQLEQLVGDILELGKLELGKLQLTPQPTRLDAFFRHQFAPFGALAQQRQLHFLVDSRLPDELVVSIDQAKLRQIANNLLANAVKFTPPGGQVSVSLTIQDAQLRLRVADTGPGIHPQDMPRLFERYFQTTQADKLMPGGTGIGLALCREYVQLLNGTIDVRNRPDRGAEFRVLIPLDVLPTGTPPTDQTPVPTVAAGPILTDEAPNQPPANRPTLLVVEDNLDLQTYIRLLLADRYRLVMADNGQQALHQLKRYGTGPGGISLVLSDIMMPVMNGHQLLERLKADDATRHLPVIMLTARADNRDKLRALRVGVDDYLLKPFDEAELQARIDNLLANQAARRQATDEPAPPADPESAMSQADQEWLATLEQYVIQRLADPALSIPDIADQFSMSGSTLLRQLKRLTGLSPAQYVQAVRLEAARRLLENRGSHSISEIATLVGYTDARSLTRSFRGRFGKTPSELLND